VALESIPHLGGESKESQKGLHGWDLHKDLPQADSTKLKLYGLFILSKTGWERKRDVVGNSVPRTNQGEEKREKQAC